MVVSIERDGPGQIRVTFPCDPTLVAKVRTIRSRRWHPDGKYRTFPDSAETLEETRRAFAGNVINVDPVLQPSETAPIDQPSTDAGRPARTTALLDRVRRLIRLKHYSLKTEKSYLPWIER
jgi:hypothetical protein